jgi:hypothetical protein
MKKLTSIAVLLLSATVLSSCGEDAFPDITGPLAESRIKLFNFSVGAPGVYFYANNTKVAGISSSTESITGTIYGGVSAGGYYTAIAPGAYTLKAQLADTLLRSTVVSTVTTNLAAGKYYSYYMSGAYDAVTKTAEAFIVEDNVPANVDWTQALVRFVNASPTSAPLTLYGTNTTTAAPQAAIGAITAYKAGSAFVGVPTGSYNLDAKDAAGVSKITRTAVSFSAGRVYTITLRGTTTLFLDNTTNW